MAVRSRILSNPKRWSIFVGCAMGAIVLVFLASTLLMRVRLGSTEEALSVAGNGAPSVRHLAAARTQLRNVRDAAMRWVFDRGGGEAHNQMLDARRKLGESLAEENKTPDYPHEQEVQDRVESSVSELDRETAALQPIGGRTPAERPYLDFIAGVARLDDALAQLEEHNAVFLQDDADTVLARQHGASWLIVLLDVVSVALAVAVALVVMVFLRHYLETMAAHNRELEMFSARVAHDLMSPLAAVGLALDQHTERLDPERARKVMQSGRVALKRTCAVVDALLDFARAGGRPERSAHAPVGEVIEGVLQDARAAAESAQVALAAAPFPACEVACSPGVLGIVLQNLVSSAIKFMGESAVRRVDIAIEPRAHSVVLAVDDTGPGLPPGFEAIMFDAYARASAKAPGLGLGLATVKRLVEAHGGRVGVERRQAGGTRLWFELPAAPARSAVAPSLSEQPT